MNEFMHKLLALDIWPTESGWQLSDAEKCVGPHLEAGDLENQLGLHLYINQDKSRIWQSKIALQKALKNLYLRGRTNDKLLKAVGELQQLERLDIHVLSAKSLEPLSNLTLLTHLCLVGVSSADQLCHLGGMKNLRSLGLGLGSRVSSLSQMEMLELKSLECLLLDSTGESRCVAVDSLESLKVFSSLKYLILGNIRTVDGSLNQCLAFPNLEYVKLAFPKRWNPLHIEELSNLGVTVEFIP